MKQLLILLLVCTFTVQAQTWGNKEYWISYEYTPKKGEKAAFEKALATKTKKWNKTPETAIFTFEVVNGPNTGTYERWVVRKDRAWFDQDFSAEIAYWDKNVASFLADESGEQTWRRFKGSSYGWDDVNSSPKNYYQQDRVIVKQGMTNEFLRVHERFAKLMASLEYTGNHTVFRVENGGNTREFAVIYGFDQHGGDGSGTFAGLEAGENIEDAYNEMFGYDAWYKDWQANRSAIEIWGSLSQKTKFRPELSTQF